MAKKKIPPKAKAKDFAQGIGDDLREDIEAQLGVFINSVARDLASEDVIAVSVDTNFIFPIGTVANVLAPPLTPLAVEVSAAVQV